MSFSRNNSLIFVLLILVSLSMRASGQNTVVPPKPYLPLEPTELFATLPPADPDWKIVDSRARNVYSVWLMAVVTREYVGPPLPTTDSPGTKKVPVNAKTSITLSDTGAFQGFNGAFLGTGTAPNRTTIGGFPALKESQQPADTESIQVWVAGRFIIKITTEHQRIGATSEWL